MHIGLHIFVVDISVRLKQLLVEAGLVERLQIHFDGFQPILNAARNDLGVEDEGEELVYLVGELLVSSGQFSDEGMIDQANV